MYEVYTLCRTSPAAAHLTYYGFGPGLRNRLFDAWERERGNSGVRLRGTEIRVSADRDGIVQNLGEGKSSYGPWDIKFSSIHE
jgi:hypothetical protein